jgi:disulfide bond formation protein DsbB
MNIRRQTWLLATATGVALVATLGSLYFSLGLHLFPCRLCWYQRILMYPLIVILAVGLYEGRRGVYRTVLPLSVTGAVIAGYHSFIQLYPGQAACSLTCGTVQWSLFGTLTIPNLSFIAFSLISLLMLLVVAADRE